jgi:predicted aspartyl protease
MNVGRIIASVQIGNVIDASKAFRCDALVDTGASHMVLPKAWKERLGELESTRTIQMETATQEILTGEVCGPVRIQIEGFPTVYGEVAFVEMTPANGKFEPLIGYIVLEQSQAGVDMLGHRLIPIKHMDLKWHHLRPFMPFHPYAKASNHSPASGGKVITAEYSRP